MWGREGVGVARNHPSSGSACKDSVAGTAVCVCVRVCVWAVSGLCVCVCVCVCVWRRRKYN